MVTRAVGREGSKYGAKSFEISYEIYLAGAGLNDEKGNFTFVKK